MHRAFTSRAALAMLILLLMLLPLATDGNAGASGTDTLEPQSREMSYRMYVSSKHAAKGLTLIAPYGGYKVHLVDYEGVVVHSWNSNRQTMGTVELLPDGTLLRGRSGSFGQPNGIHLLDWDGSVLWDFQPPNEFEYHHDIEPLPNGNILINAAVSYSYEELIAMGRAPSTTLGPLFVEPIIEIRPNGTSGGDVVWMWNPVDHLVQDHSSEKPNYGVVKDHPELIDINYPPESEADWQHSNSVSYNAELDQVMMTNRNLDEIWVIDHNTTMEEAAGHSGGAHGMGGDLLYRWGNPQAYGSGNETDHVLYGPHDGHWIGPGLPGEGNIIVFNNGVNIYTTRPEGKISTVEELVPPVNATGGYDLDPGSAYGPSDSVWRYTASPPEDFYANAMGGVQRLPDGNTLVCGGSSAYNFETDPDNVIVWEYKGASLFRMSRSYPPVLDPGLGLNATEDMLLSVDVSPFISDADTDNEDLMLEADSSYALVSGHELTMQYPEGVRTDVINLTVSDGVFMVGRNIPVNITPVNDPPHLAQMPDVEATEAVPYVLGLMPYVFDPETNINRLNITVDSPYVTVEKARLRFLYPNGVLSDRVRLTVSDGELADSTEILVTVAPVNDPPAVDRIPDQAGVEDVPWTLDLAKHIRDIDTPIGDISVAPDSLYTCATGLSLTLLYPEGVTREVVFLTVSDGESATVVGFNVTIVPVNDPPVLGGIAPLTVREDEPSSLDLGPAISDIDTPKEELTLRAGSPFVAVEGHVLRLLYPDGVLHDEVAIELWDRDLYASTTLVVDVEPVNDPPILGDIRPLTVTEDEPFSFDLGPAISDNDTPREELTLRAGSPFVAVEGHVLRLLYPDGVLHDEVAIEVRDGDLHASTTLVVEVEPVNDPPWWGALPDIAAVEDVEGQFDLSLYMNDIDTPFSQLAVEVASSFGSMGGSVFNFLYPDGVLTETVTFTLTDGEFRSALRANVTVSPIDDAPELSGAHVDASKPDAGTPYNFTVVLKDIDMGPDVPVVEVVIDDVKYTCVRDELNAANYSEGVVYYLEVDLDPGNHTFYFIRDDGDGGVVTTEPSSVAVDEMPEETDPPTGIVPLLLIIAAAVLVAVAVPLVVRRRSSGPHA